MPVSEILDDSAKRSIRLAVETGWLLAEAYAPAQTAGEASHSDADQDPGRDTQPDTSEKSSCPETLTKALHQRSRAGSAPLLRAVNAAQELAGLLHLGDDATAPSCEAGDRQAVLTYAQRLSDSLVASGDARAREAFRLGISLGELMTAPADRLRARFAEIGEPQRQLKLLAGGFEPGVAESVSASLTDWKKLLEKNSEDGQFMSDALHEHAQGPTARMWQDLLFGPGLPIGHEKRELRNELLGSGIRPAIKWGVPILVLVALAFLVLRFLSGTGSTSSRIAVAILALAAFAFSAAGPLGRRVKDLWQNYFGSEFEAALNSGLIHDKLHAPVEEAKNKASAKRREQHRPRGLLR
jgi:hypothetical protein